jgi:hypothetical protein
MGWKNRRASTRHPERAAYAGSEGPKLQSHLSYLPNPKYVAQALLPVQISAIGFPITAMSAIPRDSGDLRPLCRRLMGRSPKTRTPGQKAGCGLENQYEYYTNLLCKCKQFRANFKR